MRSAEWICTKCNTTNRVPVKPGTATVKDRCITCHTRHEVVPGGRPIRWTATAT
jgi:hypothetical protein